MVEWRRMWLAGTQTGLYKSADALNWEQVGPHLNRVTNIARDRGRTCVSGGPGLWEVSGDSGRWVQLHDETLTEVLDLAWIPGVPPRIGCGEVVGLVPE